MHCVDLGESFLTSIYYLLFSIYLQHLASIQPRTSPVKFARSPRTDPVAILAHGARGVGAMSDAAAERRSRLSGGW